MVRVRQHVRRGLAVVRRERQQILQAQHPHPAKIRLRVVALESDILPLLGDPALERLPRHQLLPQIKQLAFVREIIRVVRRLPQLLHLRQELSIPPDLLHALSEVDHELEVDFRVDFFDECDGVDGPAGQVFQVGPREPLVVADVVQVAEQLLDLGGFRHGQGVFDGVGARGAAHLAVADPLQFTQPGGPSQEPLDYGAEVTREAPPQDVHFGGLTRTEWKRRECPHLQFD